MTREKRIAAAVAVALAVGIVAYCAYWGGPTRAMCEVTWHLYELLQAAADGMWWASFGLMEAL